MRIEQVVVDASPLIVLFRSGQAELLPALFQKIWVPQAVWNEVIESSHSDSSVTGLRDAQWVNQVVVSEISPPIAAWDLGAGESAVLTVALDRPGCRAMVDDRAARRCARSLGLRTLGTAGMLVLAKRRGMLASAGGGIEKLKKAGLWLSDELVQALLNEAGE